MKRRGLIAESRKNGGNERRVLRKENGVMRRRGGRLRFQGLAGGGLSVCLSV